MTLQGSSDGKAVAMMPLRIGLSQTGQGSAGSKTVNAEAGYGSYVTKDSSFSASNDVVHDKVGTQL